MRAASPGSSPPRRTTFSRADAPRTTSTLVGGIPHSSARSLQAALLALPSTGDAVTRTTSAPSRMPVTSLRDDPGWTLTLSRVSAKLFRNRQPRRRGVGCLRGGAASLPGALDGCLATTLTQAVVERLDTFEDQLGRGLLLLRRGVLDL